MDHLPYPEDAHYPALCPPYLVNVNSPRYDHSGFLDFALRSGWQANGVAWYECNAQHAAERAQIWLYFGLLHELLGDAVKDSDFVIITSEHVSILSSSRALPSLLGKWSGARRWLVLEFMFRWAMAMLIALCSGGLLIIFSRTEWFKRHLRPAPKLAEKSFDAFREAEAQIQCLEKHHPHSLDVALTCLAVRALLWSLRNAAVNKASDVFKRSRLELSPDPLLRKVLLERGFCPHELDRMQSICSIASVHYVSAYQYDRAAHQTCSVEQCTAYILEESDYITKHVENSCQCDSVRPDLAELKRIILSGQIPVIHASVTAGNVQLNARPVDPHIPYVAISHAWSGGLGNPQNSSLPTCQITRIASLLQPLFGPQVGAVSGDSTKIWRFLSRNRSDIRYSDDRELRCVFWMDTLCIPTRSEVLQDSEVRINALSQMNRIYAEAAHVVVLDDALKGDSRSESLQLASSVYTSSWMTRCWTYLEGRLAQNLLIALDGALHDPFDLFHRTASYATLFEYYLLKWTDDLQLERELSSSLYKLRSMKDDRVDYLPLSNFVESLNEIVRRTTSREADRLIILAIMLDLSIFEAETILDKQLRLLAILRTQDALPLSFLFEGTLPHQRVNQHCNWLPASLQTPVDIKYGWLQKVTEQRTQQHYFQMMVRHREVHVLRAITPTQQTTVSLRIPGAVSRTLSLTIEISDRTEMQDSINVIDGAQSDFVYILPRMSRNEALEHSGAKVGCRLQVQLETPEYLVLSYDRTVQYIQVNEVERTDSLVLDDNNISSKSEVVPENKGLRLESDWSQWPSLTYQRSHAARPMTSKQGPVHTYIITLQMFELLTAVTTIFMIVLIFPLAESFSSDFWWTASPIEWFVWALCILLFFIRVFVLMKVEIPILRRQLQTIELQRWINSFDHEAPRDGPLQPQRPLSRPYQYYSWSVVAAVILVSSTCLAVGLTFDQPKLYDLSILSAYILFEVLARVFVEILWRTPSFRTHRIRFVKWAFLDESEGLPEHALSPFSWFKHGAITNFLFNPNTLSHSTESLNIIFKDPMYLPEFYARGSN